jgi:heme o synthase
VIRPCFRLFRPWLSLVNGMAGAGGYLLFPERVELLTLMVVVAGVTFLAAGSSALNQVLERDLDLLMTRTCRRPLPAGDLTPARATMAGTFCLLAGFLILSFTGGLLPVLLGGIATVWYLGIYTPLKRRTPFALPLGAVSGALPPVIGWCAAGGSPGDYRVILFAGLLYLWQITHFRLFQRRHGDDYHRAGIPLFPSGAPGSFFSGFRIWGVALVAAAMLLPAVGIISPRFALPYAAVSLPLLFVAGFRCESTFFSYLNFFPALTTLILFFQK